MSKFKMSLIAFIAMGLMAGCGAKGAGDGTEGGAGGSGSEYGSGMGGSGAGGADLAAERRVHFDFNSAAISSEAHGILVKDAAWIQGSSYGEVVVEGHCDERGTREYNLALGQRRADAAKSVLAAQGVSAAKIRTISYGKDRPLVDGHDEFAWAKNRRAEVVLQ